MMAQSVPMRDDRSGNDVGDDAVTKVGNLVFQQQFAFLQSGDFELIGGPVQAERLDLLVKTTMFRLQHFEHLAGIIIIHPAQFTAVATARHQLTRNDAPARTKGRTMLQDGDKRSETCFTLAVSSQPKKGMTPMDQAQVESLEQKHAALEAQIDEEEHRPHPDDIRLHELKKEKLRIKDEITGHFH
jgi:hypothetical protein